MGKLPLYAGHIQTKDMHRGLLFDKFYEWEKLGGALKDQKKKEFLQKFKGSCGDTDSMKSYTTKQLNLIESIGGAAMTFSTQWHFVTGMGIDHPLENGMAWHPTLGVPYIAGSSVKGMFRAYLWEWSDIEKQQILRWCGYTKEEGKEYGLKGESAGSLIFFDAIPIEPVTLTPDVMTPHMGDWYEKGGEEQHSADNTPADWHNPVPVLFLAVKKASFLFGIAPRSAEAREDAKEAMKYLGEALEFVGAGAKSAAGYGRFTKKASAMKALRPDEKKQQEIVSEKGWQEIYGSIVEKYKNDFNNYATIMLSEIENGALKGYEKEAAGRLKNEFEQNGAWPNPEWQANSWAANKKQRFERLKKLLKQLNK